MILHAGSRHERPAPYRVVMKPTEFWKVRDELTGKMRTTRYRMAAATALQRHPEAVRTGSPEIRNLPETPEEFKANTTSSWQRNG